MAKKKETSSQKGCAVCGKKEPLKRGLCVSDYEKYRRAKAKVPADLLTEWESRLVARGLLLPDARTSADPFMETLQDVQNDELKAAHQDVDRAEADHRSRKPAKKATKEKTK